MAYINDWEYIYLDEVDSTNAEARRRAGAGHLGNALIHAATQTAGRGRLQRSWASPKGAGIWATQLFAPRGILAKDAGGAVFLSAVALTETLRAMTGAEVMIKWPNDLVLNGKKICGMLAECGMNGNVCQWIVLGWGLNLTRAALPRGLVHATAIYEETGVMLDPEAVFREYLPRFDALRRTWESRGLVPVIDAIRPYSATLGREVRVNGEHAFALDIAPGGELVIRRDDGTVAKVVAGDVSVRGITDYI